MNMKRTLIYCKLQIKTLFHMMTRLLLVGILLVFSLGFLAYAGSKLSDDKPSASPSVIALVIEDSSPLMDLALKYLESSDSVEQFCTFVTTTQAGAEELLKSNGAIASIYFPKHFAQDIVNGKNTPATITLSDAGGISQILFQELTTAAAKILSAAQANIYTFDVLYDTYPFSNDKADAYDYVNQHTLRMALNRGNLFQTRSISTLDTADSHLQSNAEDFTKVQETNTSATTFHVNSLNYYLISTVVLFFLFFGIGLSSFFFSETDSFKAIMSTLKLSLFRRFCMKFLALFLLFWFIGNILFLLGGATGLLPWKLLSALPLVAFFVSSWNLFIHQIAGSKHHATLLLFTSGFLCSLFSGCLIPSAILPQPVSFIGKWLPTHFMHQILCNGFVYPSTESVFETKLGLLLYSIFFLLFTYISAKYRERRIMAP